MRKLIADLEEIILAGSGVDSFREIFKLLYVKLYIEKYGAKASDWQTLFDKAKQEWPGVFFAHDSLALPQPLLKNCIALLSSVHLFGTDLSVLDAAFEQLLPEMAKGNRGQYFTPRYVIRAMVAMLHPTANELILDPAAGSGGFLFETLQSFAGKPFTPSHLYGIDFDERAHMVCTALLLIAGYEDTHIHKFNSLDKLTPVVSQLGFSATTEGWFDVVLTNPPFGGEVRDPLLLAEYSLARDANGKIKAVMERHILFLERIIALLKPGGRAAIVVPQGMLNNTNLASLRTWLFRHARILGVVGLDTNTFKPYTTVKTSILLLQKWEGSSLPDYSIFMSVSQASGKDASGNLVIDNGEVRSDLGAIALSFREFASKEHFGF